MIRLIRDLFDTPGAEPDAEGWATRFCAHQGLAALVMLVLLVGAAPMVALAMSLIGYAIWEAAQWWPRRSRLLWWDCALDWTAWALTSWAVAWLMQGDTVVAAACAVSSLIVLAVGIYRRS
ncbi:hypothetical protein [Streptomyces sp. P17]|uniref:hypothetical protein n=1 Tax=Streptomyces sp. P17 TaxID=3074716 RepID=UPI0028F42683|nr:hypothetical protein [Streptomyces sp. P17]MDT9702009.1 hypothetical protein [Streptomyces sp. P17]